MLLDRVCKICSRKFQVEKTKLTPVSICSFCRKDIVHHNVYCLVNSWEEQFPEVTMRIKFKLRKLKQRTGHKLKYYFYITGDTTYTGRSDNIYASHYYFVSNALLPMIQKSFSNAHITNSTFEDDNRRFKITVAEY